MARAKQSVASRTRRKATLKAAKGYYGNKSRSFRAANEQVMHSGQYAFRDRRARKGEFRRLWIQRINAAARQNGTTYSRLMHGLATAGISVDRKNLADLAVTDSTAFAALAQRAEVALADGDSAAPEADASSDEPAGADASGDESADADASADEPADAPAEAAA